MVEILQVSYRNSLSQRALTLLEGGTSLEVTSISGIADQVTDFSEEAFVLLRFTVSLYTAASKRRYFNTAWKIRTVFVKRQDQRFVVRNAFLNNLLLP